MESGKRKREGDGAVRDRREVTDAEVEEFYAILGRIRDAARCLSTTTAPAPPPPNAVRGGGGDGARWRPAFAWEDFAVSGDATTAPSRMTAEGEGEGESAAPRRFDLNAEPEPEVGTAPR